MKPYEWNRKKLRKFFVQGVKKIKGHLDKGQIDNVYVQQSIIMTSLFAFFIAIICRGYIHFDSMRMPIKRFM